MTIIVWKVKAQT